MVNGSSNTTGYINGTSYTPDILTFVSSTSNDSIIGAYKLLIITVMVLIITLVMEILIFGLNLVIPILKHQMTQLSKY